MSEPVIHTRREFVQKGLTLLSAAATVPYFLDRTAWAMADPFDVKRTGGRPGNVDERVLVVLQLAGGNDGLNTVIPFQNDAYYRARPRIGIARDEALKVTDQLGFHPRAEGLKKLYDAGLLAVVQGVGYPNPNRSHFVSTDIWSTGDPTEATHNGWIGRYFDCTCSGSQRPESKLGIALTSEAPLAMAGARFSPVSFGSPDELTWRGPGARGPGRAAFEKLNKVSKQRRSKKSPDAPLNEAGALAYLERMAMDARASAAEIQEAAGTGGGGPGGRRRLGLLGGQGRGGELGQQLTMVRRMIAAGLKTRVYYVSMGGFDTHAQQPGRHQQLMGQLGEALADFVDGLKADGLLDRVLVMSFSEFGRRVAENGSQGTDHGAAAPLFVVGSRVKAGFHGEHPGLEPEQLDQGDLKWLIDFRSIYAAVLEDWLKADSRKILGGEFSKLTIV